MLHKPVSVVLRRSKRYRGFLASVGLLFQPNTRLFLRVEAEPRSRTSQRWMVAPFLARPIDRCGPRLTVTCSADDAVPSGRHRKDVKIDAIPRSQGDHQNWVTELTVIRSG
jgi:hypothetical protein